MSRKVAKLDGREIKVYEMDNENLQKEIDRTRIKIAISMAYQLMRQVAAKGAERVYLENIAKVSHLWYDSDQEGNLTLYQIGLRDGPPPSNHDRPVYLRDLDLLVDPLSLPDEILFDLVPGGKLDRRATEIEQDRITNTRAIDEKTEKVLAETRLRTMY